MRLTRDVALVGSGWNGFSFTSPKDCHVYLLDGGSELALVDAGIGDALGSTGAILDQVAADGYDPDRISKILLTHYHLDHIGGTAELKERLGAEAIASPLTATTLERGDEDQMSITALKSAGSVPADYRLTPCTVERVVDDGDQFQVGNLSVTAYATPGHCDGHLSFLVESESCRYLLAGDFVFVEGKISLQNIHDCFIQKYSASVAKIAQVPFDALLPGHRSIALRDGRRHIESAQATFATLKVP